MRSIYLVAYYYEKPAGKRIKTSRPGWMKEPNSTTWDEQVTVTRSLKNRDITMSKIILDLFNKKVIRNSWNSHATFDDLFVYFCQGYPNHTKDIMLQIDPEYYFNLFPSNKPKETASPANFDFTASTEVRIVDTPSQVSP